MPTAAAAPTADLTELKARLTRVGQSHVLNFHDKLDPAARRALFEQIAAIDLDGLPALIDRYVTNKPRFPLPEAIQPAPFFAGDGKNWNKTAAKKRGQELLRAGKVAAFVVAGGQGSRLGYEGPKGCYPAGAVTRRPLFELFAEALLGAKDRYGKSVPWYVMTSPLNHDATERFFREKRFLGLDSRDVMFFQQGVMPSFDARTGQMLMATPSEIAANPDGHGGSLNALHSSGALRDMRERDVEIISYFQVDNPIVNLLDPVFLGLHADKEVSSGEMSSKMVPKASAEEKVGVFCISGAGARKGRVEVVEYSDLPIELAQAKNPDGSLKYIAGSIAVHALGVSFVEKLNTDARFELPYHRADKKVPCCDPVSGAPINPTTSNGVKLERFVFDALPMCERSVVLEADRVEEFAPIKNADGADSPESCSQIQTSRAARWLETAGVKVPRKPDGSPDCVLEISPRRATTAEELTAAKRPSRVEPGMRLAW